MTGSEHFFFFSFFLSCVQRPQPRSKNRPTSQKNRLVRSAINRQASLAAGELLTKTRGKEAWYGWLRFFLLSRCHDPQMTRGNRVSRPTIPRHFRVCYDSQLRKWTCNYVARVAIHRRFIRWLDSCLLPFVFSFKNTFSVNILILIFVVLWFLRRVKNVSKIFG